MVPPLGQHLQQVAWDHLGSVPDDLEFHGQEIWSGTKHWNSRTYDELIAVYEAAKGILDACDIDIAYASINKAGLHARYNGRADANVYRLALQFLLEKVDAYGWEALRRLSSLTRQRSSTSAP